MHFVTYYSKSTIIESCQKKVENFNYESRKRLFEYDEVLNLQRRTIYRERKALLKHISVRPEILSYGEDLIVMLVQELKALTISNKKLHRDLELIDDQKFTNRG